MRYRYVIFDVGGTLLRWGDVFLFAQFLAANVPHSVSEELSADAQELQRRMIEAFNRNRHLAVGMGAKQRDLELFWRQVLDDMLSNWEHPQYGRSLLEPFTRAVLDGYFDVPFDDAVDALQRLRAGGYRLGVISNWSEHLPSELERLGLAPFFDFVIVSSLVGVAKPSPEIFRLGLAAAGCLPHQALYVGDNVSDDCEGARRAGLDVALISRRVSNGTDSARCTAVYPDLTTLASRLLREEGLP